MIWPAETQNTNYMQTNVCIKDKLMFKATAKYGTNPVQKYQFKLSNTGQFCILRAGKQRAAGNMLTTMSTV